MFIYAMNSQGKGVRNSGLFWEMLTLCAGRGSAGSLLHTGLTPLVFASCLMRSFSCTRFLKSSRHLEGFKCSTRTFNLRRIMSLREERQGHRERSLANSNFQLLLLSEYIKYAHYYVLHMKIHILNYPICWMLVKDLTNHQFMISGKSITSCMQ